MLASVGEASPNDMANWMTVIIYQEVFG